MNSKSEAVTPLYRGYVYNHYRSEHETNDPCVVFRDGHTHFALFSDGAVEPLGARDKYGFRKLSDHENLSVVKRDRQPSYATLARLTRKWGGWFKVRPAR